MNAPSSPIAGCERLLAPAVLAEPDYLVTSDWLAHVPFAFWLTTDLRPRGLVELGATSGVSYCAFLQAATMLPVGGETAAVGSWAEADAVAFANLQAHHDARYATRSRLLQLPVDEARQEIADGSLDLLHIDGMRFCDEVIHTYASWRPKLGSRGILLLHGTAEVKGNPAVRELFLDLAQRHPAFHFAHGCGLGLIAVGSTPPEGVTWLISLPEDTAERIRAFFAAMGNSHTAEARARTFAKAYAALQIEADSAAGRAAAEHATAAGIIADQAMVLDRQAQAVAEQASILDQQADVLTRQALILDEQARILDQQVSQTQSRDSQLARQAALIAQQSALIAQICRRN